MKLPPHADSFTVGINGFFNSHCSQYIIREKTCNEYVVVFFIIINGITPCHAGVRVKTYTAMK